MAESACSMSYQKPDSASWGSARRVGDFVDRQEDEVAALALVEEFLDGKIFSELQEQCGDDVDVLGAVLVAAAVGFVEDLVIAGNLVYPFGQRVPLAGG